jgi:cellulose synthase/poly-beta-1,6-N-acetylglucosamine synthase-like glycosyltransferase
MRSRVSTVALWIAFGMIVALVLIIPCAHLWLRGMAEAPRRAVQLAVIGAMIMWFLVRPVAVVASDRLRGRTPAPSDRGVSIVIPCCNSGDALRDRVGTLLAQSYRPIEIVLVENNSTDDTPSVVRELAEAHPEVIAAAAHPFDDEYGASVAVNVGVALARYDVILRMDDDTHLHRDAVARGLAELEANDAVAVACDLRISNPGASVCTRIQAMEYLLAMDVDRRSQALLDSVLCCSGGMSMFRRDMIVDSGGFVSAPRIVSEDMDITLKAHRRGRVAMAPECIGFTEVPPTMCALMRQRSRWAISGMVAVYLHRQGIANRSYWSGGAIGFIGLPFRAFTIVRDLLAPLYLLDLWLLFSNDGPAWFLSLLGLRAVIFAMQLAIVAPALNRRETKQGLVYAWLIPVYVLWFGPALLLARFHGSWAAVAHILELRRKRVVTLSRGLVPEIEPMVSEGSVTALPEPGLALAAEVSGAGR